MFIGLQRSSSSASWKWRDGTTLSYSPTWAPSEPATSDTKAAVDTNNGWFVGYSGVFNSDMFCSSSCE